jgi:hypothetical protein
MIKKVDTLVVPKPKSFFRSRTKSSIPDTKIIQQALTKENGDDKFEHDSVDRQIPSIHVLNDQLNKINLTDEFEVDGGENANINEKN